MEIYEYIKLIEQQRKEEDSVYHSAAVKFGMSDTAMWILYVLSEPDSCVTQQDLCRQGSFPKQTVNTVVKELERQGYVFFQTGKKEKQVRFTEAGRAFAGPCLQELYEIEDRAVAAMGEARFREMVEANRAFTEAFAREVQHG